MQSTNKHSFDCHASSAPAAQAFAIYAGSVISRGCFWSDVQCFADALPERDFVINLCQNRYLFSLTLLAAAVRGQTCLLPPSNQQGPIAEICADYPDVYCVSEQQFKFPCNWFQAQAPKSKQQAQPIDIDWKEARLIAFTSGSSGKPQAHSHSFETFRVSAHMATRRLGLENQAWVMLSTTPPQHMYGLETSVFWPLFSELIMHDGRPFFPEDLRNILVQTNWPSVLATTPAHLRHLISLNLGDSSLVKIVSATDTLSEKLATQTKVNLGMSPVEIYGSTETLSFASRETLLGGSWQLYDGCALDTDGNGNICLNAAHLPVPVMLQDSIHKLNEQHFKVLGRHHDMIKVAGKRVSLNELNRRLRDIDGVEDGFFFVLSDADREDRLAIAVVSQLDGHSIKQALEADIDPVFMPKKIHFVPSIPRNQAGKLAQADQDTLLRSLGVKVQIQTGK